VRLLYGSGLRITEAVRLRILDVDFAYRQITVRSGKGNKDRVTTFPVKLAEPLQDHLRKVAIIHEQDLAEGYGEVYLPNALARRAPNAPRELKWQYVFPSVNRSVDPRGDGKVRRHHVDQSVVNKAIKRAAQQAGIKKRVSAHTLRHYSARRIMPSPGVRAGGARAWRGESFGIIRGSSGRRAARRPGGSVLVEHRHWQSWRAPALSSACRRGGRFASSPRTHVPAIRR
jgi:integrase